MRPRQTLIVLGSFVAGLMCATFVPRLVSLAIDKGVSPDQRSQVARVTSPDGTVDAILESHNCGVSCGLDYSVIVVPRGANAPTNATASVFLADDVVKPQIEWKQTHLLEIAYDRALVEDFRSVAYPLAKSSDQASRRYAVEVRLAPSSSGFSYLESR